MCKAACFVGVGVVVDIIFRFGWFLVFHVISLVVILMKFQLFVPPIGGTMFWKGRQGFKGGKIIVIFVVQITGVNSTA
jgi:hypothetical protein